MASLDRGEKTLLQIGGLSGVLVGIVGILSLVALFAPAGPRPDGTEDSLRWLVQNRTSFATFIVLAFIFHLLFVPLFLALYRNLRAANSGHAFLGGVFGLLGVGVSLVSISVQSASSFALAGLYEKATDKTLVVSIADVFNPLGIAIFRAGGVLLALGFIAVGGALLGGRVFPRRYGWVSSIFGTLFIVGLLLETLLGPSFGFVDSEAGEIVAILWAVIMGWKVYRLSKVG